jgi:hypothetical protein
MKTYTAVLKSTSPYSQSRYHDTKKLEKESAGDYEDRTWMARININSDGFVFIMPMALKICLEATAKYLSMRIPGAGKSTYSKHFLSGVLIMEPLILNARKEDVIKETFLVPANGLKGGGTRVVKHFPAILNWETTATIIVLDEVITKPVLELHLQESGKFMGLGRFRPQNGGFYGRFNVESLKEV